MTARTRKATTTTTTTPEETKVTPTATPTAPAKSTAPAKRSRTVAPPIDLTSLVVESAPLPVKSNAIPAADNPAMGWLRKSWASKTATGAGTFRGSGQQVRVPQANSTMVSNLIRSAAQAMSNETGERIGAAVQIVPDKDGMVYVRFCAKTAKQVPAKKPTATA